MTKLEKARNWGLPSPRKCDRATLNFSASPVGYARSTKHLTLVFKRIFCANLAFNLVCDRTLISETWFLAPHAS
ncbi:hypothetical protein QUB75_15830 [Microcoleus sp. K1-B6]|uniref:hypothetical protein n=1 Tax=unclassified Microcoleus TaxID=2642155 RepID=UPI002FD1220F